MTDQVTDTQDQDQTHTGGNDSLGWRAGLPDEFKSHDWAKEHTKVGDFFKSALETKDQFADLQSKLENAVIKPGEDATEEEVAAYRKALGVPETADEYEFPKGEGVEHDPAMVEWAKKIFYESGLTTEQASHVAQAWDEMMQGIATNLQKVEEEQLAKSETVLKEEWKDDYGKNVELSKRAFLKFAGEDLANFKAHPTLIKAFYEVGKAMGEDDSPPGSGEGGKEPTLGMQYSMPTFGG